MFTGDPQFCIFYDYFPASSDEDNDAVLAGNTINCTIISKLVEFGFGGDIMLQNGTANDTLIFKTAARITFDAYFNVTGDFNGINRTGEGVPGSNSQTNLTTADFNDYANDDYRLDPTSNFVTNGSSSGFMGAAVAPAGGGISVTVTETGPSFTESINSILTAKLNSAITESGPSFVESIAATLTALEITATITESGPSFTELIGATVVTPSGVTVSITEVGPSFTESINTVINANISAGITEQGPSFVESSSVAILKDITLLITESGPSFTDSIAVTLPVFVTINPKNIIQVKRSSNNVTIKAKSNMITVNRKSNIIRVK